MSPSEHSAETRSSARRKDVPENRDKRKARTRRGLLDSALELMSGDRSFSSLSLREITKAAGVVPAAFYRHFDTTEAMGLALVEESFVTLRRTMRELRAGTVPSSHLIRSSLDTFLGYVLEHDLHFRFIAKERYGGSTTLRMAIRQEVRLFTSELATDLARAPKLAEVTTADLQLIAGLIVQTVMNATELTLDAREGDVEELHRISNDAARQLAVVVLGANNWRSLESAI